MTYSNDAVSAVTGSLTCVSKFYNADDFTGKSFVWIDKPVLPDPYNV